MYKVHDIVDVGGCLGTVYLLQEHPRLYYVGWTDPRDILNLFNIDHVSKYTKNVLQFKYPIKYYNAISWDSPDFKTLEDLSNWVDALRNELISKQIKILK